jgi:hypothetical protein
VTNSSVLDESSAVIAVIFRPCRALTLWAINAELVQTQAMLPHLSPAVVPSYEHSTVGFCADSLLLSPGKGFARPFGGAGGDVSI